ncbi:hypothetical protein [Parabacteroides sp.]
MALKASKKDETFIFIGIILAGRYLFVRSNFPDGFFEGSVKHEIEAKPDFIRGDTKNGIWRIDALRQKDG